MYLRVTFLARALSVRARLHVDVLALLLLGLLLGTLQPVLELEGVELIDDILEAFFLFELQLRLSKVLLVP